VVVDDGVVGLVEFGGENLSAIAMPTALEMPWPSGPVVVSMPGA